MSSTITEPKSTAIECPPADELKALIRGDVDATRLIQLTDHIGECPACQARMDRYAAGDKPEAIKDVIRDIDRKQPPRESALWKVLDLATSNVTRTLGSLATPERLDPDLKFLQPSDVPGRLGMLGIFEVVRMIGRGGMGVVLHAFDPDLQRDVAVKILDPQLASNTTARQRFCREARAAAAVTHEHIVAVHSVDEDNHSGLPFFVMQLVVGESLEQRLRRVKKMPIDQVIQLGKQAASGLAAAHAVGLIHRDVKPGNILLEKDSDHVRLTDFGLARAVEDLKLTRTGFVSGTPLYMAPEQATGEDIDQRADIFSLGVVMYEALTGKPPFDGKTPLAVLRRVADEPHEPISKLNPDVPGWLEDTIDRMLTKDPASRISSASDLVTIFNSHVSASSVNVPECKDEVSCMFTSPTSLNQRARRIWKIRFMALIATSVIAGAALGGGLMYALSPGDHPVASHDLPVHPIASVTPTADALSTPLNFFRSQSGAVLSIATSPDEHTLLVGIEDGRILIYDVAMNKVIQVLEEHKGPVWGIDFFPDSRRFVSVSDDNKIKIWNLNEIKDGKSTFSIPTGNGVRAVAVDRHGKNIATGDRSGNIVVWDVKEQKPNHQYSHGSSVTAIAFSKDDIGQMLATAGSDKTVKLWDLTRDQQRLKLEGHKGPVYSVAFSADSEHVASAGWDGTIRVWNADDGSLLNELKGHEGEVWSLSFAPFKNYLASTGLDGTVRVWDAEKNIELTKYQAHKSMAHIVRFSPDGGLLISGGRDGEIRMWDSKVKR